MPKISALPNQTAPDAADELPTNDVSATTTKKMTLTVLKQWFQSLTGWITSGMIGSGQIKTANLGNSTDLKVPNANLDLTQTLGAASGKLVIGGILIQWGTQTTATIGTTAGTEVSGTITFPTAFSQAPIAVVNPSDLGSACAEFAFINATSTTTANYFAGHALTSSGVTAMTLRWIAIGPA